MIEAIIVCSVVLFIIIILIINKDKMKSLFSKKNKQLKTNDRIDYDKQPSSGGFNYEENKFEKMKKDSLNQDKEEKWEPFIQATEQEIIELKESSENKRKRPSDISKKIQVEDLGEYDENKGFFEADDLEDNNNKSNIPSNDDFDDDFGSPFNFFDDEDENKSVYEQIKNLSPEIKALLLSNALGKKDDQIDGDK